MEKICEFCTAFRPVVYCQADAARLCLSCDTKVHSANLLSSRHPRTLLCDSCGDRPAYIRCLNHRLFMCHGCDRTLHDVSSQHRKNAIQCYTGCPSPKHFVTMWGFQMHELDNNDNIIEPCGGNLGTSGTSCATSASGRDPVTGSSCQSQIFHEGEERKSYSVLLQQIIDLNRLHLTKGKKQSSLICGKEKTGTSSIERDETLDQKQFVDRLLLSFSETGNAQLSPNIGVLFPGESLWQGKSPIKSSQLWSQNLQDLGVCEDIICNDDFDIPEVDLTFRNFEELFAGDQGQISALLDDDYTLCSTEKDLSLIFEEGNEISMQGASSPSAIQITSAHTESKTKQIDNINEDSARPIHPTLSCSFSKSSANGSDANYFDSRLSPITGGEASTGSTEIDCLNSEAGGNDVMMKFNETKKARLHENASRKSRGGVRKRVRGRFAKIEDPGSDDSDVT